MIKKSSTQRCYEDDEEVQKTWLEIAFWFAFLTLGLIFVTLIDFLIKYKENSLYLLTIGVVILMVSLGIYHGCYDTGQTCFSFTNIFSIARWR